MRKNSTRQQTTRRIVPAIPRQLTRPRKQTLEAKNGHGNGVAGASKPDVDAVVKKASVPDVKHRVDSARGQEETSAVSQPQPLAKKEESETVNGQSEDAPASEMESKKVHGTWFITSKTWSPTLSCLTLCLSCPHLRLFCCHFCADD